MLSTWSPIRSDYIDPEMAAMNDEMRTYPWQKTYMFMAAISGSI